MTRALTTTKSKTTLRREAKVEAERKAASKAALHAAIAAEKTESDEATASSTQTEPETTKPEPTEPKPPVDHHDFLDTLRVDFEALGQPGGDFNAYVREQGVNPDTGDALPAAKTPYFGPMVALKTARLHYVEAKNGVLCNGDKLALVCGQYEREATVRALIRALKLEGNPYSHLNPGQQSMNLRNKARHALKDGTLTIAEIEAAYKAA